MDDRDLVQSAERALRDAEQAYRDHPSGAGQRRMMRAWKEVREARGEPTDDGVPYPLLSSHPPAD